MFMEIITGGAGSGKSEYLYSKVAENLKKEPDTNAVLIVPEQFSFTSEKALSEAFGGLGPSGVEVLTFSRLIKRFLKQKNRILPSGKMMLLQTAAKSVSKDNIFYLCSSRSGFTEALSDLFSEFKRYAISPEDLESLQLENEHTAKKLSSINEIYKKYTDSFSDEFSDGDDEMALFAELAENSDIFSDTFFYIDDYSDFMPTHYGVIKAFLKRSRGVFVTLPINEKLSEDLFIPITKTKNRLVSICENLSAPFKLTALSGSCKYIKSPDIRYLIENWDEKPKYSEKSENISVFNALDMYSEAEHTASTIISLVRDNNLRFRDIGIICGNIDEYLHILTSVFADFNIPFFTDAKLSVSMHPVAKTVLSLFEIIKDNWSYSSVFEYLRTGYIYERCGDGVSAISQEDIDLLENYVLALGIKGKKAWFSEWTKGGGTAFDEVTGSRLSEEFDLLKLNELRVKITMPFEHFLENKGRTASAIAEAVYNFMCDINLYDGLILECAAFDAEGRRDEAEQFKQVWNFVIETLDQLVSVCKSGTVSRADFADLFSSGLSMCEISIIPSGLDRVFLGSVSRNAPTRVKALFIIGAIDGQFPSVHDGGVMLSDFDRSLVSSALKERQKELAPDSTSRIMLENFKFYKTLTTAEEKLFISFPSSDSSGNAVNPAHFVSEIVAMFGITVTENIISEPPASELLASSKRGFYYMLSRLSECYRKKPEALWNAVYEWYSKNPEYKEKLDILKLAAAYKKAQPALARAKAELLYGKNKKYSITALEKYEKCPFSYYLERGLRLTEKKEYEVGTSQIGSLIHLAIYEFCHAVEDGATSLSEIHSRWTALTDADCEETIGVVMSRLSQKVLALTITDTGKTEYLLSRCETTLKNSVSAVRKSLSQGEYAAICYEKDFEVQIDWKGDKITLIGKIDRIDIMEQLAENKLNIRIVDYKSGHKDFSVNAICDKVDMQLVMYAIAAEEMAKGGVLTGNNSLTPQVSAILYSKISDMASSKISLGQEVYFEDGAKKTHKMDGLFIIDGDAGADDAELSPNALFKMDPALEETRESDFLNIKINSDGNFPKNAKVASRAQFEVMAKYIKKAAVDADKAIKAGKIDINPYSSSGGCPCDYCPFGEICMFDEKHDGYRIAENPEDIFSHMEKEVFENG